MLIKLLTKHIAPLLPSSVKDTTYFFIILKDLNHVGLATERRLGAAIDVCSLYTNIPVQEGF